MLTADAPPERGITLSRAAVSSCDGEAASAGKRRDTSTALPAIQLPSRDPTSRTANAGGGGSCAIGGAAGDGSDSSSFDTCTTSIRAYDDFALYLLQRLQLKCARDSCLRLQRGEQPRGMLLERPQLRSACCLLLLHRLLPGLQSFRCSSLLLRILCLHTRQTGHEWGQLWYGQPRRCSSCSMLSELGASSSKPLHHSCEAGSADARAALRWPACCGQAARLRDSPRVAERTLSASWDARHWRRAASAACRRASKRHDAAAVAATAAADSRAWAGGCAGSAWRPAADRTSQHTAGTLPSRAARPGRRHM